MSSNVVRLDTVQSMVYLPHKSVSSKLRVQDTPGKPDKDARPQREPVLIVEADLGPVDALGGGNRKGGRQPQERLFAVLDTDTGERKVIRGGQIHLPTDMGTSRYGR
jgi:hypothetical protein